MKFLINKKTAEAIIQADKEADQILDSLKNKPLSKVFNMEPIPISGRALINIILKSNKEAERRQLIDANNNRVDKFATIQGQFHEYWKAHISPTKKATEAAILLERTDIFKEAMPQPKRRTIEGYVREWQKLQK